MLLMMIFVSSITSLQARDAFYAEAGFTVTETESGLVFYKGSTAIPPEDWHGYVGDKRVGRENNPSHVCDAGEYDACTKNRIGTSESGMDCNLFVDFIFDIQGNLMNGKAFSLANINARYIWNFGDGQSAEGSDIKHEFTADGEYTVCLTVIQPAASPNERDCEETICKTITIGAGNPCDLEADFSFNLEGNQFSASATSNSDNNVTYEWKISDGTSLQGKDISHTFLERGEFEICLVATRLSSTINQPCTVTVCKKIGVGVDVTPECPLEVDIVFVRTLAGNGALAKSNDPNAEFYWYISSINFSATGQEVSLPLNRPGVYQVCLIVTSAEFECRKEICKRIVIGNSTGVVGPNPAYNVIRITSSDVPLASCTLVNAANGYAILRQISGYESTVDITDLSPGLYFLKVNYEDGTSSIQSVIKH